MGAVAEKCAEIRPYQKVTLAPDVSYVIGTGELFKVDIPAKGLSTELRKVFDKILESDEPVDRYDLASLSGLLAKGSYFRDNRFLAEADVDRVNVSIVRIRQALNKVQEGLAKKLQVEKGRYFWGEVTPKK